MRTGVRPVLFVPLTLCTLAVPRVAAGRQGQSSSTQVPVVRETVQVTATKIPEAPHDVPTSIEVISGDELRNLGAANLKDALALATGVAIAPGGDQGPAGSVPEFWGLREFDAFLLVVDSVPWGGAFNPALTSLSMRDVERVEILRGAAPVTYGATSFAGVIHVVHKAAAAERSYAAFGGGSYSSGNAAVDLALPKAGAWSSRLTADFDRQGFKDDRTSYGRGHALFRMSREATDSRTWFSADLNVLRQDPASPHPRQGTALTALVPVDANHNPDGAYLNENRIAVNFGMENTVGGDKRLGFLAAFSRTAHDNFRGFLADVADVEDNAVGFRQKVEVTDIYADVHLAMPERAGFNWVVGADFLHGMGDSKGQAFDYTVPLDGSTATRVSEPSDLPLGSEDRREFFGSYVLAEWHPTSRVTFAGGLRLNATFEEREEGLEAGGPKPADENDSQTNVRPSGSVGVLVSAWEGGVNHVRLFANYRNTFKPAVFDFGLGEEGEEGDLLEPETAQSVDGGMKARWLDGRLDLEVSGFRMDFRNLVTATVVDGLPALINSGETRFQGLELAADLRLPRAVTARATYGFHDGRFVDFERSFDGVVTQLAGKRFEMSARHLLSAGLVLAPEHGFIASLVVKHTGDRYLDKRNRALAGPFTTVDVGVGYRFDEVELRLDGRNLSDARDPVSESEVGDAQYYRMTARDVRVSLGIRF